MSQQEKEAQAAKLAAVLEQVQTAMTLKEARARCRLLRIYHVFTTYLPCIFYVFARYLLCPYYVYTMYLLCIYHVFSMYLLCI